MALRWCDNIETLDWQALSHLYEIAPLGHKPPAALKTAFGNSMFCCLVYQDEMLVAAGRALADGVDCSYICDVAVHPEQQGSGLGKEVINKLIALSRGHKKIILYANPGKEAFYRKLGFQPMNTAMAIFEDKQRALDSGLVSDN